ncbi:MAG: VWA domain-containing protein [Ilumatobacteraceae bacterium]|nr:VWA domain-containing protein [Ilumatobacteraceae bacterium]
MDEAAATLDRLIAFGHAVRNEGIPVGSGDLITYCEAFSRLDAGSLEDLYWSGRATLVNRRDQIPVYDRVFERFFLGASEAADDRRLVPPPPAGSDQLGALDVPDNEPGDEPDDGRQMTLGLQASNAQISRTKAFSACSPEELAALRRIMLRIKLTPPQRRSRRHRRDVDGRRIDMRRIARDAMRLSPDAARLHRTTRKRRPRPLVLLLDVSGSMSDYSRNLLQFAYSTRRAAGRVEVFCFGTRLTRITSSLDRRRPDDALRRAADQVLDWDGGTRIGESIDTFVRRWGRRGMSRGAIVVICSDGLDRGDPAVLAKAVEQLSRLCYRLVWVNPHVGDATEYEPTTLGMMVAAPYIDAIVSGHNLGSLEEFVTTLPTLSQQP